MVTSSLIGGFGSGRFGTGRSRLGIGGMERFWPAVRNGEGGKSSRFSDGCTLSIRAGSTGMS